MLTNKAIGATSNINGRFELAIEDSLLDENIIVSYVGYESQVLQIKNLPAIIHLHSKSCTLEEVQVNSSKKNKTQILNKFRKGQCVLRYSNSQFNGGEVYIPYCPNEPSIESIHFTYDSLSIGKKIVSVQYYFNNLRDTLTIFRVRIYNTNEDGFPQNDLLNESLLIKVRGAGSQIVTVDLDKYGLCLPKIGISVGYELLMIPENSSYFYINEREYAKVKAPLLYLIPNKKTMNYFFYSKGKWNQSMYWVFNKGNWSMNKDKDHKSEIFTPAISLEVLK